MIQGTYYKEWSRMLYEMKSEVRLINYRVTVLETTKP